MRQDTLQNMTRLEWDQSFLEDFSSTDSSMNSNGSVVLRAARYEDNVVRYENIYNDLGGVRGSVVMFQTPAEISCANSSAVASTDRLKFLLNQVERKKRTQHMDNSYSLSSSHLSPLITDQLSSPESSSLPPSPTLQPKSMKVPRKEFHRDEAVRSSPREDSLARNDDDDGHGLLSGEPITPSTFFIFRMVERFGLARLLWNQVPQDPIFSTTSLAALTSTTSESVQTVSSSSPYSAGELQIIRTNLVHLLESGFYLGKLNADESRRLLGDKAVGTFFVRDSSNPGHLLSLSVQTRRGATSIRIHFREGMFGLEADAGSMFAPKFDSVIRLVQYYAENPHKNVLVESSGRCDTPVVLKSPLLLRVPRLSHLARLTIQGRLKGQKIDRLCLIPSLKQFLKQYPFSV